MTMRELRELRKLNPEAEGLELGDFPPVMEAIGAKDKRYRVSLVTILARTNPVE